MARRIQETGLSRCEPDGREWGWNPSKTVWVPPFAVGVSVNVDLLRGYVPNPVNVPALNSPARDVHLCASRRGGKTHCAGRVCAKRSAKRYQDIVEGRDPAWPPERLRDFMRSMLLDDAGEPKGIRSADVERAKWPVPCLAISPTHDLTALQKAELSEIFDPWTDELGVVWYDGIQALAVFALGILWRFASAGIAETKVGSGYCIIWAGEAARLRSGAWEHFLPSLADRRGSLVTDTTPWGGRDPNGYWGQCWVRGDAGEAVHMADGKRKVEDIVDPAVACFHWTAAANLAVPHLAKQMADDIRRHGAGSAYVIRTWFASWASPEGALWPAFDSSRHVTRVADWTQFDLWIAGQDWGFSESEGGHPGALVIIGVQRANKKTGARQRLHVIRGFYGSGIFTVPADGSRVEGSRTWAGFALETLAEIRRQTRNPGAVIVFRGAPERPEAWSAMRRPGIDAGPAQHVNVDGIEDVERLLVDDEVTGQPRLTFEPAPYVARDIVRDIQAARWSSDSAGRQLPCIDKTGHDPHGAEALIYAVQAVANQLDLSRPFGARAGGGR